MGASSISKAFLSPAASAKAAELLHHRGSDGQAIADRLTAGVECHGATLP